MKKQIALGLGAVALAVTTLPLFAAFEAHVINVTAKIENALKVDPKFLNFGTVFPQEKLEKPIDIELSQSFKDEGRVDDVEYFIRQKPKCAITWDNGTKFDETIGADGKHINTATGHIKLGDNPATQGVTETSWIDCGPAPRELTTGETWGVLPNLCPYLSKHSQIVSRDPSIKYEDGALDSFHKPWVIDGDTITWTDVQGRLAKSNEDIKDTWMIDLAVPCFGGYCAQDWESFVHGINASANPAEYTQPIANEHKVFGCDLWVEVSGVSTQPDYSSCGTVLANAQGQFPPSGTMLNAADYSYVTPTNDSTAGNAADHKWVHLPTPSSTVIWDMGVPTKVVTLIPSIDHGPVPAEAKEATLQGSNDQTTWETGVESGTYNAGPSTWISDDYTTRWVFTQPYKYVRAIVGGTLLNDGDAEIDAVCSAK